MNNLMKLKNDLEIRAEQEEELDAGSYIEPEFTKEDQEVIDKIKATRENRGIVVTEIDENGRSISQPIDQFAKSLDDRITKIVNPENAQQSAMLKTLNTGEIDAAMNRMKTDAKKRAYEAYRSLAIHNREIDEDSYDEINRSAFDAIQNYFGVTTLNSDVIIPKMKKMPLSQITRIIPKEFWEIYVTEKDIASNNYHAKERLLTVIGYLMVTGPEMDYLNQYIEDENKLSLVSQRILRCQIDFAEMLKDERTISELVSKTLDIAPNDQTFWSKYIKLPNRITNEYAQRAVLQEMYEEAYTKLLDEYPVYTEDELVAGVDSNGEAITPESVSTSQFNEKAREVIRSEIDEAKMKREVYLSITNLELLKSLYPILETRYMTDKRMSLKFLEKECKAAIERARRCKQNVPYPGFKSGMKKDIQVYESYMSAYSAMILNYNKTIMEVYKKECDETNTVPETEIEAIWVSGVRPARVAKVFSMLLAIMMGRIMKKCTENDATKYDAIVLDSYFQMFSQLGTDIYVMNDIWKIMKPLVEFVIQNVQIPEKW